MTDLLPVTNDFVFAKLFGSHKGVLIKLLNAILAEDPHIESIEFLPTEMKRDTVNGKEIRLDIIGITEERQNIHIEMQCTSNENLFARCCYYSHSHLKMGRKTAVKSEFFDRKRPNFKGDPLYMNRIQFKDIEKGDKYIKIPDVISIWICKQNITPFDDCVNEIRDTFQRTYMHDFQSISDRKRIILIELNKINNIAPHLRDTDFEKWINFIKDPLSVNVSEIPELEEAYQELKHMSADESTRRIYESRQATLFDIQSNIEAHVEKERKKWMEEKEDLVQEKETLAQENEKLMKREIEMVKNMLSKGLTIEQTAEISGFSIEEIKAL